MIIKKIYLENIRSYEDGEISLQKGSTLLSGDIGSGKTSVLLAVEFALFGLEKGNLSGSSLLRTGRKAGRVRLEMEIADKQIVIERILKRTKSSVVQDAGYIEINNEKQELSPTGLKQRVLELLSYPPDYLTKTNLLYRYTIYTPQESMREILLEKAELRTDTLRRIFGIDKYKTVSQNLGIFASKLRESIRNKEGMITDLEGKKSELAKKGNDLSRLKSELDNSRKALELLQRALREKKLLQAEQEKRVSELSELKTQVAAKKSETSASKEQLHILSSEEKSLEKSISAMKEEAKNFRFRDTEKEIREHEKILSELDMKRVNFEKNSSALNNEKRQHENVKIRISEVDSCPLCMQNVPHQHKLNILTKASTEIERLAAKIKDEILQKEAVEKAISEKKRHLAELQETAKEQILIKTKLSRLEEKAQELRKLQESRERMQNRIISLEQQLAMLAEKMGKSSKLEEEYEKSKKEVEKAQEEERHAAISNARIEKDIESIAQAGLSLGKEIKEKENIRESLEYLNKMRKWLQDKFSLVLSAIEQAVMAKLHADFSQLFEKWFSMFVSELSVRLDENFTPIIESRGYELDYAFLSGGERTAVALAYRLALNQVINSFISKIRTRDILILDEPTDGFSSEQLDRMRDVLAELKVKQLILVSHEAKIESFVENIIRFKKEDGMTRVQ